MQKDRTYHDSAIRYNDALAEVAEDAAEEVEHPVVKGWCRSVAKQHRYHAKKHRASLERMDQKDDAVAPFVDEENANTDPEPTIAEQQAKFAAEQINGEDS